jgi:site-specific DNA recombinase
LRNHMLPENRKYFAALYMRLSKDDEGKGESASITTQRKMLRAYAAENHYPVYDEYVDDGISGTTFERPDFRRMIRDIESGRVNMVITKDLSRLGRDYIQTGQYTEIYFPTKKVRYIAINDGYDSDSPCTDIAPFKNIINEMYARDISKKIRSSFTTHMQEGAFVGAFAPYGYMRDPADKHHLVIDREAAKIVREIFLKASEGILPIDIARELNRRMVPTPLEYRRNQRVAEETEEFEKRRGWTSSTITKMLRNVVYLGHMAQGKTTKISFKSRTSVKNPKEDWYVVKHTHEPLVSREVFSMAGRRSRQRTCAGKGEFTNIFSGIAKCADCGRNMSIVGTRKKDASGNLACGAYKLYGTKGCTNHFMDYDTLCRIVLTAIQKSVRISEQEEREILEHARKYLEKQNIQTDRIQELSALKKRLHELDRLIEKLYEDHVEGLLSEERMKKLLRRYESENREVSFKMEVLRRDTGTEKKEDAMEQLRKMLHGFTEPEELSRELLFHFIDHIEIGQGSFRETEQGRIKEQTVRIYFRFGRDIS